MKEAQDITTHLKPLAPHFQYLESQEFTDVKTLFPPLLHLVCLVYSHSDHYNTAARIIILLQVGMELSLNYLKSTTPLQFRRRVIC